MNGMNWTISSPNHQSHFDTINPLLLCSLKESERGFCIILQCSQSIYVFSYLINFYISGLFLSRIFKTLWSLVLKGPVMCILNFKEWLRIIWLGIFVTGSFPLHYLAPSLSKGSRYLHTSSYEIIITVFRVSQEVSVQIFWMSWNLSIMGDIIPQNARSLHSLPMKSGNLTLRRLKRAHHDVIVLGLSKCSV